MKIAKVQNGMLIIKQQTRWITVEGRRVPISPPTKPKPTVQRPTGAEAADFDEYIARKIYEAMPAEALKQIAEGWYDPYGDSQASQGLRQSVAMRAGLSEDYPGLPAAIERAGELWRSREEFAGQQVLGVAERARQEVVE